VVKIAYEAWMSFDTFCCAHSVDPAVVIAPTRAPIAKANTIPVLMVSVLSDRLCVRVPLGCGMRLFRGSDWRCRHYTDRGVRPCLVYIWPKREDVFISARTRENNLRTTVPECAILPNLPTNP
jgi:hypothetical protein